MSKLKIISGGQTGADLAGLWAGVWCGLPTGGTAPKNFRTLKGSQPNLQKIFNVTQHESPSYPPRTLKNVQDSSLTLIFASNVGSSGTKLTLKYCEQENKRAFIFKPDVDSVLQFNLVAAKVAQLALTQDEIIINVAGNSSDSSPGIFQFTFVTCVELFRILGSNLKIDVNMYDPEEITLDAAKDYLKDRYEFA